MSVQMLPKDPMMLLSFVNTTMRDEGIGLDELCRQFDADRDKLEESLKGIGYAYNHELRRFV